MSASTLQRAAQQLAALRRAGPRPRSLPVECAPETEVDAYEIQRLTASLLGARTGGWKVAMTNATTGTSAPVFAQDLWHSPSTVTSPITDELGIEPEIAFTLAADLPPGRSYDRRIVTAAIGSAHAAIEVVVSRFQSHVGAKSLDALADNISNGGLVIGSGRTDWQSLDLKRLPLKLTLESASGSERHEGDGGHPLGDPLLALEWLANHLAGRGIGLRRGEVITTGSYAGLKFLGRAGHARAQFGGLEAVEVIHP